ncbi:MFS transporter [Acuticoccus mangrovi]|uniref:MFS transporter n=1 Tax=Acuticoccus mangrovi TaxID=2796142 RepID=A0A934INE1_9HYPH|nr:MFS transporter [Acuticoccus mangrovi]MBJ3775402.1 MFS transporter [Acuticoccus mangrovi]
MRTAFYRQNAWWLGTGALFAFGSAFGQTYFISLFSGVFRSEFGLSDGEWGGLYTIATLASAVLLINIGRLADTLPLVRLAVAILIAYTAAALVMMVAAGPVMLAVAVFGLRFCGQGMMSHLAMTAMARWFRANRGKAVAVAVLGYPAAESLYPLLGVSVIDWVGWRATWGLVAAAVGLVLLPTFFVLLRHGRTPGGEGGEDAASGMQARHWTRREVLRHWSLWALLPGILAPPFIGTCAIFHQVHIATVHGFALTTLALAFPLYAGLTVATSLVAGPLIDRIGPVRVLPFFLLPIAAGVAALAAPGGAVVWFAMLCGLGLTQGFSVTLLGSVWATLYGTRHIGSIKALATAAMVFATAAGPGITGALIDAGITFPEQALVMSAYCLAMSGLFLITAPRLAQALAAPVPQAAA